MITENGIVTRKEATQEEWQEYLENNPDIREALEINRKLTNIYNGMWKEIIRLKKKCKEMPEEVHPYIKTVRHANKYSRELKEQVKKMYEQEHKTIPEIATIIGVSGKTTWKIYSSAKQLRPIIKGDTNESKNM